MIASAPVLDDPTTDLMIDKSKYDPSTLLDPFIYPLHELIYCQTDSVWIFRLGISAKERYIPGSANPQEIL